jgi:3-methyladenine DNA glycosylase AlkD
VTQRETAAPPSYREIHRRLVALASPARRAVNRRYFKTGKGEYGEGDRFLGLSVPLVRKAGRELRHLPLERVVELIESAWHEERQLGLVILVDRYVRGSSRERDEIHELYLANIARVNNWDLVDGSAPVLVGRHLPKGKRSLLDRLARSGSLWERRIAMLATQTYIRQGDFDDALRIAEKLLFDDHDLIHKAVGWMLREVADRDRRRAEGFLSEHAHDMPRTALRYAIEKFPPSLRKKYLAMKSGAR